MSKINTNVSSLIAQRVLRRNNGDLNKSLERLSTGLKINKFGVPAAAGGATTNILAAHPCVSWLGGEQPRLSEPFDLPPYDPSVCDEGSDAPELCTPAESAAGVTPAESAARAGGDEG